MLIVNVGRLVLFECPVEDVSELSELDPRDPPATDASLVLTCSPSSISVMELNAFDRREVPAIRLVLLAYGFEGGIGT
jgi:hypothetical protein